MTQLNNLRFPFLGIRENGEPFEYLLESINEEQTVISFAKWMTSHYSSLNVGESVNLFIPSNLTLIYHFRRNTPGVVNSIKGEHDTYFYTISFEQQTAIPFSAQGPKELAQNLSSEFSLLELLRKLVKDSLILKEGVLVHLKHLSPYFSRIVDYSQKDYQGLKNFIFDDVKNKVSANIKNLYNTYKSVQEIKSADDIPVILNLENFREEIESEISLDLFMIAFANLSSKEELMALLMDSHYQEQLSFHYFYMYYIISIKDLEKRLYSNYNQIVLLYLKSI